MKAHGIVFGLIVLAISPVFAGADLKVSQTRNSGNVPLYEVFELTFQHDGAYDDPFADVTIDVEFTAPSGKTMRVGGFHYGSSSGAKIRLETIEAGGKERKKAHYEFDKHDLWKARLAPPEVGEWRYRWTFKNAKGELAKDEGGFRCVKGRRPSKGFLRLDRSNPFRLVYDDGGAFFPIGLQDCWGDGSGTGSLLDACSMEGPFRTDRQDAPELPVGAMFVRGPANNPQNADVYFRLFSQCGFNMYRFSQQNCSFPLNDGLERYRVQEGIMTDELLIAARRYNFRMMYGILGFQKAFNNEPENDAAMEQVRRFIKYSVDRWGAYVDIWEFLNEQKAADGWYKIMIPYLQSIDPYGHPLTTSWERPELEGIELNAPHWYGRENELQSDSITANRARNWKKHGKPVMVGEQGNSIDRKAKNPPGVGGVWDVGSARRMRIRNWTATFSEISVIFWNTSYARDGHFMNIWLGPREREYVRAMQDFAYRLGGDVRPAEVQVSDGKAVRAYGLASKARAGVYLHHYANHEQAVRGLKVSVKVPRAARGYWYAPASAEILGEFDAPAGAGEFVAPDFTVDLALLITPDGPPDIDGDGQPNDRDADDDNDGTPDVKDAFPLDPSEWADKDGDLIGDNQDADDDADGKGDDLNRNGKPDCEELDFDGDGVPRTGVVPWDAFPLDAKEWRDTDGDGIGDNADPDDDNDGWSDVEEQKAKTDPRDAVSFPAK